MAVATRRASEHVRRRSLHYVEHTTEHNAVDADTTPGMDDSRDGGGRTASGTAVEDDCRDAGRLQGCRS